MSNVHTARVPGNHQDPSWMLQGSVLPGCLYPFWHLLAPADATDPWIVWWLVGGISVLVGVLPSFNPFVRRNLPIFYYGTFWLIAFQFYVLAALNDMHPFYAVGCVMAVALSGAVIRSKEVLLAYACFVTLLGVALFSVAPHALKVAFWMPGPLVLGLFYYRLSGQLLAEQMLADHQQELEERVAQRTEALSLRTEQLAGANAKLLLESDERRRLEDKMRLSQKMEAVGRLAGGVAHDFNNLLTAIRGYGDLVLQGLAPTSPLRDDVAQIIKSGDQASELTQRLLAFSRKHPAETSVFDVNDVLRDMAPMLRRMLGEDVEIVHELMEAPLHVRVSRNQLEQVVLNLALNARDAMPGGGKLSFETRIVPPEEVQSDELIGGLEPERYVLIAVSDTGLGMDAQTQSRIFDPFFTTKPADEGTGLGLSTAYGTVKQAGGHIRVLSEPRRGARFELYFPEVDEVVSEVAEPATTNVSLGCNEQLLLVEDDDDIRQLFRRVFRTGGYAVREAKDARSALELVLGKGEPFDLLVSDVVMPHMNGLELAERILEARPDARILFVSGHRDHPSLRRHTLPPGVRILAKPVSPAQLLATVREVLDQPPRSGAS